MSADAVFPQNDFGDYIQAWAESLSQVLGQIAAVVVPCTPLGEAPAELPPAAENDLWIVCTCSGGLRGEESFRIPGSSAIRLAQRFMSEAENPETPLTPEHHQAVVEFFGQVAGIVASAIKPRVGEVQFRLDPASGAASWPPSSTFWLRAGGDDSPPLLLETQLSAALVAALRADRPEAAPQIAGQSLPPRVRSPEEPGSQLGLLMDVELAMTLRFGGRQLSLREILEFCPGTVVELDRQVDEPVDLLLHGKLVARGEVVVVDGNYGLRVTEVVAAGS
ncbi:MAG TPA: flagellar motor switch protein FliN [Terriglobales bacterium]|nr:flagellar motor switch protein FliN [Terriglobales bacterium]